MSVLGAEAGARSNRGMQQHVPARLWTETHAEASSGGAWTAALVMAAATLAVPVWLLGAGAMLSRPEQGGGAPMPRFTEIVLIGLGAAALICSARAAIKLGFAPRLRSTAARMRPSVGAGLATAGVILFLRRVIWGGDGLLFDPLALLGAVLPIYFLADASRAMSILANGRHGTAVGATACCTWLSTAALLSLAAIGLSFWWLPAVVACAAAAGSALAGTRIWQRYEGDVVTR